MLGRLRQHQGELLHAGVLIDDERGMVHEHFTPLGAVEFAPEWAGKAVDQALPAEQTDGLFALDDRQDGKFGFALETGDGVVVAGAQGQWCNPAQQGAGGCRFAVAEGVRHDRDLAPVECCQGVFRKRERGLCRGAGDEITLAAGDPHLAQAIEIFTAFDPFGDQCGIADPGQILHGAYEMVLDAVIGDAMYKMLVDLDEFRLQLGPHAQVGEAFAQIVDGDLETAPAIVC